MGTVVPFPRGKARTGRDADHSHPSSTVLKNEYELYLLSPLRLHGVLWDCFTLLLNFGLKARTERRGQVVDTPPTYWEVPGSNLLSEAGYPY
jgi:hypothetical protein